MTAFEQRKIKELEAANAKEKRARKEFEEIGWEALEENEVLKNLVIQSRLPRYCLGKDCGCIDRVAEQVKKDKIKLAKELEDELQALKPTSS